MWQFASRRTATSSLPGRSSRLQAWFVVLAALFLATTPGRAQDRYRTDPVDELRQVLKEDRPPATEGNMRLEFPLRYREEQLGKSIRALRNPGDMSRALLLQNWRLDAQQVGLQVYNVDRDKWDELAKLFSGRITQGLAQRSLPSVQVAVANLLADTALSARDAVTRQGLMVRGLVSNFGGDLLNVIRDRTQDPAARAAAAHALGLTNPREKKAAVDVLQGFLQDGTPAERRVAANALANLISVLAQKENRFQGETRLPNLESIIRETAELVVFAAAVGLGDPDPQVRRQCVTAIEQAALAGADLVVVPNVSSLRFPPPGREATRDEVAMMRAYKESVETDLNALSGLSRAFRDVITAPANSARPGLAQVSALDPDPETRLLARQALEQIGNINQRMRERLATVPVIPEAPKQQPSIEAALANRRRKPELVLTAQARSEPPQDQLQDGLGKALPDLIRGLRDRNPKLRLAAVEAIETLGGRGVSAVPALAAVATDASPFVRWAAARTLGKMAPAGATVAVPALARLLLDVDTDVQINAARALENYGPAAWAAIPTLIRIVTPTQREIDSGRSDAEFRVEAIHALESIGRDDPRPILSALTTALDSRDADVRRTAAEVIARFGPAAQGSQNALQRHLLDPDLEVRSAVSDALLAVQPLPK